MKYHNKKVIVDNINFMSKKEANRYKELKLLEEAGCIKDLKLQPAFTLIPKFKKNNKTYRETKYIADFSYFDIENGKYVIEDTKGYRTQMYKLKKKLFEYKYGKLEIKEL